MTGLLPCVAVINVACQAAVVASDVSPRLFLREATSPPLPNTRSSRQPILYRVSSMSEFMPRAQGPYSVPG